MRICIVSDAWTPQVNGVVRTYRTLVDELTKLGHTVEVIGPDRFRNAPKSRISALWMCPQTMPSTPQPPLRT